jgi:dTDP-4-dehydrorhamnose 3,5-epimerase
MRLLPTTLPGCVRLQPVVHEDHRGRFVKTMHHDTFASFGLRSDFLEEFYSVSTRHVMRGLHLQLPPADHAKLVYCTGGEVLDAVVDLRVGSPTHGRHELFELSANRADILYIPSGMAHGFLTLSDSATLVYKVTSMYSPPHDSGIRWDSAGIPWPVREPVVSERDQRLPTLGEFQSPFVFPESEPAAG